MFEPDHGASSGLGKARTTNVRDLTWALLPGQHTDRVVTVDGAVAATVTFDRLDVLRRVRIERAFSDVAVRVLDAALREHAVTHAMASTGEPDFLGAALHIASSVTVDSRQLVATTPVAATQPAIDLRRATAGDLRSIVHVGHAACAAGAHLSAAPATLARRGELVVAQRRDGGIDAVAEVRPVATTSQGLIRVVADPGRGDQEQRTALLTALSWYCVEMCLTPMLTVQERDTRTLAAASHAGFAEVGQTMALTFDPSPRLLRR